MMRNPVTVLVFMALFAAGMVSAESPRLLFDRSQIDTLRQRITQPKFAPIWTKILADAEAYCNPASKEHLSMLFNPFHCKELAVAQKRTRTSTPRGTST